jgi:hypothetical protein
MTAPHDLGPMPADRRMTTIDRTIVRAPLDTIFELAADVEGWVRHLPHYRYVRFQEKRIDGGGIVEMSANRPFGPVSWPTWWTSLMSVHRLEHDRPTIRFRHIRGITTGMDVEWSFEREADATVVTIVHVWNGPPWPLIGEIAARAVIGPIFVHGIASRTLAGLRRAVEAT